MVIVSRKFNMPVGSLVKSKAGNVYEVASKPFTAKDGNTVLHAVNYGNNKLVECFPDMVSKI